MADIFDSVSKLRMILDTETDYDSPVSEELVSQVRENFESMLLLLFESGSSGSATADPSNDATGNFEDSGKAWTDDEHNGRVLLITSGSAKGNFYTIDDTGGAGTTVCCTGDNLYSDGVRSGDGYQILYNVKSPEGHSHDGIDSRKVVSVATGAIGVSEVTRCLVPIASMSYHGSGGSNFTSTGSADTIGTFTVHIPNGGASRALGIIYGMPNDTANWAMRISVNTVTGDFATYSMNDNSVAEMCYSGEIDLSSSAGPGAGTVAVAHDDSPNGHTLTVYGWTVYHIV